MTDVTRQRPRSSRGKIASTAILPNDYGCSGFGMTTAGRTESLRSKILQDF